MSECEAPRREAAIKVTLVFPTDLLGTKVGGIETFIRGFIRHAPQDIEVSHVGTTSRPNVRPVGSWHELEVGGRLVRHLPVLAERDENEKKLMPLALRFTRAVMPFRESLSGNVLLFNRIEPAIVFLQRAEPMVGFIHNDILRQLSPGSEYLWCRFPAIYLALEKRILSRLNHVYTVNSATMAFYRERYQFLGERLAFLPTWVDSEVFGLAGDLGSNLGENRPDAIRAQLNLKRGFPRILFVGRLQHQKHPELMLASFRALLNHSPNAVLTVVGEGNLRETLLRLAGELGVFDRMDVVGFLDQKTLARLYRSSELLLLTSRFEGMPRACLEALGCGTPVVTTQAGEVGRFVHTGRSGIIVRENQPGPIAEAMAEVLQDRHGYTPQQCVEAVDEYRPGAILDAVYARCRELASKMRHGI